MHVCQSIEEVSAQMRLRGATLEECAGMEKSVAAFVRWAVRRGREEARESGIAWLREIRERMPAEGYEAAKAGLTTWFHLTGKARTDEEDSRGQGAVAGIRGAADSVYAKEQETLSAGGRVSGEAETWKEAGERLKGFLARKSYSKNTVECYVGWARRFCRWCLRSGKDFSLVEAGEIRGFLEWLAGTGVVAKTQNQALNALVSFFRHGMGREPGEIGEYLRAKASRRLPVVLDRNEAAAVMNDLEGRNRPMWLMAGVMLGSGLRQRELLELRVKDLDLERGAITVRQGKGDKDRLTVLPERIREGLKGHLAKRRVEFEKDLEEGAGYVPLPGGLARKRPKAARSWAWQFVFGGQNVIEERETGRMIRWHVHENTVGRLLGESARRAGVVRQVSCHALRHTFATLALENGTDIRTLDGGKIRKLGNLEIGKWEMGNEKLGNGKWGKWGKWVDNVLSLRSGNGCVPAYRWTASGGMGFCQSGGGVVRCGSVLGFLGDFCGGFREARGNRRNLSRGGSIAA